MTEFNLTPKLSWNCIFFIFSILSTQCSSLVLDGILKFNPSSKKNLSVKNHCNYIKFTSSKFVRSESVGRRSNSKSFSAHYAAGSDELVRPEDEDSPEFKEYLRALLKMQANRSKTGYAAPSSGSSDAYIAKLNRLKIERNARIRAGLPDAYDDTGYKEIDYINAKSEGQEPVVANSVISGGNAVVLSKEAQYAKEYQEKVIQEALAQKLNGATEQLTQSRKPAPSSRFQAESRMDSNDLAFIDSIIENKLSPIKRERDPSKPVTARKQTVESLPNEELLIRNKFSSVKRENIPPKPILAQKPTVETPQVIGTVKPEVLAVSIAASSAKSDLKKKSALSGEDLETTAKSLQLLVKHRGGGPFGLGRLQGNDVLELESVLKKTLEVLKKDSTLLWTEQIESTVSALDSTPEIPVSKLRVQEPKTQDMQIPSVNEDVRNEKKQSIAETPARGPSQSPVVTISTGIDKYLSSPDSLSLPELMGLRDGLIDVLSRVQKSILTHGPLTFQPIQQVDSLKELKSRSLDAANRISAGLLNPVLSLESSSGLSDQELRTTLGLLLKHRGGPGFGSGRLKGVELDALDDRLKGVVKKLALESNKPTSV